MDTIIKDTITSTYTVTCIITTFGFYPLLTIGRMFLRLSCRLRRGYSLLSGPRFEVRESLYAPTDRPTRGFRRDYGFVATLDDKIRREIPVTDVEELDQRITDLSTILQDTQVLLEAWDNQEEAIDMACSEVEHYRLQF
ncbi:hypothetical protein Tco_1134858 [Tanacetum coccineum]